MKPVFGDSFFFIALLNSQDSYHQTATDVCRDWTEQIVTTRWVLAEVGNALSGLGARNSFVTFLEGLRRQGGIIVLPDSDLLFEIGMALFARRPDKEWSLTDCISFEAMRKCGLDAALTGDHHFAQAGFQMLLKD